MPERNHEILKIEILYILVEISARDFQTIANEHCAKAEIRCETWIVWPVLGCTLVYVTF